MAFKRSLGNLGCANGGTSDHADEENDFWIIILARSDDARLVHITSNHAAAGIMDASAGRWSYQYQ